MVADGQHLAVIGKGGLDLAGAVGHRIGCGEMLETVFDPFDRPPAHPRSHAHQHDRHVEHELYAECTAGMGGGPDAQAIARHPQRPRHHRVQRERALEV
jgi:hypothetical protein